MKRTQGLASLALASLLGAAGCGGDTMTTTNTDVTTAHGDFHKFVVSRLLVPQSRQQFAIDLNGDGKVDNQLGNIVSALASMSLNPQKGIDDAVTKGSVVILTSIQTTDASLKQDDTAGGNLYLGTKTTMPPDFGGMGMFTVDSSQAPGHFFGKLSQGQFLSNNPITTKNPVTVTISLPLISGTAPLSLKVNGAHLKFQSSGCQPDPDTNMTPTYCGELHGSIKNQDIQDNIIPAVAALLTQKVNDAASDPNTVKQIESIFDTGGCTDKDGTMAMAMDHKITVCEVAQNNLIANLLAPDVQIFDSAGNYAPSKANAMKDSMSLGLGFEAVGAVFTAQ